MKNRGFTIFFAMLVATLSLSIGLVMYDLLNRELSLSQVARESQYAIYAADTGAECALYWDLKYNDVVPGDLDGSAFATSSTSGSAASGVTCTLMSNGTQQDIAAAGTPPAAFLVPPTNWTAWVVNPISPTYATTTFWMLLGTKQSDPCVKVEVGKSGNPSLTNIVSHGYNTCNTAGVLRLERSIQVNY